MRNRGIRLLLVLAALLVAVLVYSQLTENAQPVTNSPEMLLDSVMDRIGVTQITESLDWMDMDGAEETPVWVARRSIAGSFHSVPICGGMKSPVRTTAEQALAEGRLSCPICWD